MLLVTLNQCCYTLFTLAGVRTLVALVTVCCAAAACLDSGLGVAAAVAREFAGGALTLLVVLCMLAAAATAAVWIEMFACRGLVREANPRSSAKFGILFY